LLHKFYPLFVSPTCILLLGVAPPPLFSEISTRTEAVIGGKSRKKEKICRRLGDILFIIFIFHYCIIIAGRDAVSEGSAVEVGSNAHPDDIKIGCFSKQ
jgi:hypothetical protein